MISRSLVTSLWSTQPLVHHPSSPHSLFHQPLVHHPLFHLSLVHHPLISQAFSSPPFGPLPYWSLLFFLMNLSSHLLATEKNSRKIGTTIIIIWSSQNHNLAMVQIIPNPDVHHCLPSPQCRLVQIENT